MDNKDKNFFIALAYVAAREDISDPTAFRKKSFGDSEIL